MPSYLAKWMKEERKKIEARNKRVEKMLKYAELGKCVSYELKKDIENVKEFRLSELSRGIRDVKTK